MARSPMQTSLLPPGLIIEQVRVRPNEIVIRARSRQPWARLCGLQDPFGADPNMSGMSGTSWTFLRMPDMFGSVCSECAPVVG